MIIIWGIKKVIATRDAAWRAVREKAITDKINAESHLLDLSKEQYDWLRDNGLKVTQATHDHFYPPYCSPGGKPIHRQPLDCWGDRAQELDPWRRQIAEEQRLGIEQQRRILEASKDYSNVTVDELLGASVIRVGTPPRAYAVDANGVKPVAKQNAYGEWETSW